MSIISIIRREKEKFNEMRTYAKEHAIKKQSESLKLETIRQKRLAEANSNLMKQEQQLKQYQTINEKAKKPNRLLALGVGLAKVINKNKQKNSNSGGAFSMGNNAGVFTGVSKGLNTGSRNVMSSGSRFDLVSGKHIQEPKKKKKQKQQEIIIRI
jgi:hypothetical protein